MEMRPDVTHIHMLYIEAVRDVLAGHLPCSRDVFLKLEILQHSQDVGAEWKYVRMAERLPLYGAEVFGANKTRKDPSRKLPRIVEIAVHHTGIILFEDGTKRVFVTYPFHKVTDICVEKSPTKKSEIVFQLNRQETRLESPRAFEVMAIVKQYQFLRTFGSPRAQQKPAEDVIDSPHDKENDIDQDALALSDNDVDVGDDELSEISEESEHGDFTPTI